MPNPTTKAELVQTMQTSYTAFEQLLTTLDETQLTTPGVNGDWSVKDILAHIAAWHTHCALSLEAVGRGEEPDDSQLVNSEEEMHRFNADTFAAKRAVPLDQIWHDLRTSYQRLQTVVEALNESDLFEPQRFAWLEGHPLWRMVAGDTFEHYPEHALMIEEWLARQKA
jgi:hypothetical protein